MEKVHRASDFNQCPRESVVLEKELQSPTRRRKNVVCRVDIKVVNSGSFVDASLNRTSGIPHVMTDPT